MKKTILFLGMLLLSLVVVQADYCSTLDGDWTLVPGDANYGTDAFCVMTYEAKNVGGVATSQAALNPWVSINQTDARARCSELGDGYHLITNNKWMTIARNIEQDSRNWNSGNVGEGGIYRGNVNLNDGISCNPGSVLDGNTAGTNCLVGGRNKRMLYLSNGETIWDLSGNV
jgi:hypothetical protein